MSHIALLIPYTYEAGRLASAEYDYPEFRAEIPSWFEPLGHTWAWHPVALGGPPGSQVADVLAPYQGRTDVVVYNLCDGTDADGVPGVSTLQGIRASRLPWTGGDERFYTLSTYKTHMKWLWNTKRIPTAPWMFLGPLGSIRDDVPWGSFYDGHTPMLIKPDASAASLGITLQSRVVGKEALRRQWEDNNKRWPGRFSGWFAEAFVEGPEYTVFVIDGPEGPEALVPAERVFSPLLPPEERYLTRERYTEVYIEETPPPPGHEYCRIARAPEHVIRPLQDLAIAAYRAVYGRGYARVDIRQDARTGVYFVLEVNTNCGLSFAAGSYTGEILRLSVSGMHEVTERILQAAVRAG